MHGWTKLSFFVILFASGLQQLFTYTVWPFIHNINLVFHEAGHIILSFFGRTIHILGGTIFEIGVPLVVLLYFAKRRDWFAASCVSWWCATAFLSVSVYASDAQERVLPLLTNDRSTHDWYNLLRDYNLLAYDNFIGSVFWSIGLLVLLLGALLLLLDADIQNMTRHKKSVAEDDHEPHTTPTRNIREETAKDQ